MVVATDTCFYTEMKIFPGHGIRAVRRDGKLLAFLNGKAHNLWGQKIKAQRLTWTQAWRRRNKKGKADVNTRRKAKKTAKVYRAIQGFSIEEMQKRRSQQPSQRADLRAAQLREIKQRKKKAAEEKKKLPKSARQQKVFVKRPKTRRLAGQVGRR